MAVPRGNMDSRLRGNDWHGAGVPLKCHCGNTKWLTQLLRQTKLGHAQRCGTRTRISLLACLPACLLACLAAWLLGCLAAWLLGCLAAWLLGCQSVTQSGLALAHNMQASHTHQAPFHLFGRNLYARCCVLLLSKHTAQSLLQRALARRARAQKD